MPMQAAKIIEDLTGGMQHSQKKTFNKSHIVSKKCGIISKMQCQ